MVSPITTVRRLADGARARALALMPERKPTPSKPRDVPRRGPTPRARAR
jgi:hypothetical protein